MDARYMRDKTRSPLWDTVVIPVDRSAPLFEVPIGQGESVFEPGRGKTAADTNMVYSNHIPTGHHFQVEAVECEPAGHTPRALLAGVVLRLWVGSKYFVEIPASRATHRLEDDEVSRGWLLPGMKFAHRLDNAVLELEPTCPFGVEASNHSGAPVSLRVVLDGLSFRPVQ